MKQEPRSQEAKIKTRLFILIKLKREQREKCPRQREGRGCMKPVQMISPINLSHVTNWIGRPKDSATASGPQDVH